MLKYFKLFRMIGLSKSQRILRYVFLLIWVLFSCFCGAVIFAICNQVFLKKTLEKEINVVYEKTVDAIEKPFDKAKVEDKETLKQTLTSELFEMYENDSTCFEKFLTSDFQVTKIQPVSVNHLAYNAFIVNGMTDESTRIVGTTTRSFAFGKVNDTWKIIYIDDCYEEIYPK